MKALWSQQKKQFFSKETDYCSIYLLAFTRVKLLENIKCGFWGQKTHLRDTFVVCQHQTCKLVISLFYSFTNNFLPLVYTI